MSEENKEPAVQFQKIYGALARINDQIEPIKKDQTNTFQGYKFRGIDQVYNLLQAIYSKEKVMPLPRVLNRISTSFDGKDGKKQFRVEQEMIFKLMSTEDGSFVEIGPIWGEALDTSDKATNKSNSAAAKYAFLMAHLIPTQDMIDADKDTPEAGATGPQDPPAIDPKDKIDDNNVKVISYAKSLKMSDLKLKEHTVTYFKGPMDYNDVTALDCKKFCEYLLANKDK